MPSRRGPELTDYQKGLIQAYKDLGCKDTQISHVVQIKRSTISSFISRVKKHGFHENKQRVGCPRKSSIRDDRSIIRKAVDQTHISLAQLRHESNSNLSISTLR